MIPNLSGMEWAAVGGVAVTVLLLGGWGFLAARLEAFNTKRFGRESARLEADEQQRQMMARLNEAARATADPGMVPALPEPSRLGVGERLTGAAYWIAVKALRLDRKAVDRAK